MMSNDFFNPVNPSPFTFEIMQEDKEVEDILNRIKMYLFYGEELMVAFNLALIDLDLTVSDLSQEEIEIIENCIGLEIE